MTTIRSKASRRSPRKGLMPLSREELRARVGGVNPCTLRPDEEERFELFEKIRKFYVLYTDGSVLKEGLGEIVEWALSNGEYELNQRLKKQYKGFDLESTTEHSKEERKVLFRGPRMNTSRNKTLTKRGDKGSMLSMSVKTMRQHHQSTENGGNFLSSAAKLPSEEDIREKLREFYKVHDPGMLDNDPSFDRVVLYALQKGIQKLNLKLQKKFKTTDGLEFNEEENESVENGKIKKQGSLSNSITSKKTQSFSTLLRSAEIERAEKKQRPRTKTNTSHTFTLNIQNPAGMLSVAGSKRILPSVARDLESKQRLPPQLKLFLKMYYSCYDPIYIVRDKLTGAKLYAEEVGMEKFDQSLQTKYKESLTDFQGRVELLQDKLQNFYLKVDLKRTNDVLMGVLQWTLRNGEVCLNRELRRKYGVDLKNFMKPQGTMEPEPISTPEVEPKF